MNIEIFRTSTITEIGEMTDYFADIFGDPDNKLVCTPVGENNENIDILNLLEKREKSSIQIAQPENVHLDDSHDEFIEIYNTENKVGARTSRKKSLQQKSESKETIYHNAEQAIRKSTRRKRNTEPVLKDSTLSKSRRQSQKTKNHAVIANESTTEDSEKLSSTKNALSEKQLKVTVSVEPADSTTKQVIENSTRQKRKTEPPPKIPPRTKRQTMKPKLPKSGSESECFDKISSKDSSDFDLGSVEPADSKTKQVIGKSTRQKRKTEPPSKIPPRTKRRTMKRKLPESGSESEYSDKIPSNDSSDFDPESVEPADSRTKQVIRKSTKQKIKTEPPPKILSKTKKQTIKRRLHESESESEYSDTMSSSDSSDSKPESIKKKRKAPVNKKKALPASSSHKVIRKIETESESSDNWQDVEEKANVGAKLSETEFIKAHLKEKSDSEQNEEQERMIVVDLSRKKPSKKVDPDTEAKRALQRLLRETLQDMHRFYLMATLYFGRSCNRVCDGDYLRVLSLSLLTTLTSLPSPQSTKKSNDLEPIYRLFLDFVDLNKNQVFFDSTSIQQGIKEKCLHPNQVAVVMISALRQLDFDVRLVICFNSIPLKMEISPKARKMPSLKFESKDLPINIIAEIYLPHLQSFVPVSFHEKKFDTITKNFIYSFAFHSTKPVNKIVPYSERSPLDISLKYDKDYDIASQEKHIPIEDMRHLLEKVYLYSDVDCMIVNNLNVLPKKSESILYERDQKDLQTSRAEWYKKPLPTSVQVYKKHPLYALERNLLKYEVIYPPDARVFGNLKNGERVFSRDSVHLCHTRETWIKQAKAVKLYSEPAKIVKARLSRRRKLTLVETDPEPTTDLFGEWQVEDYVPPVAKDGIVPRNEHNSVDVYQPCMIPIGCVHLNLPGLHLIARDLKIDHVSAVVGWTFHGDGRAVPKQLGHVVCKESAPTLIDAWREKRFNRLKAQSEERSRRALANWVKLAKNLQIWQRINAQYSFMEKRNLDASKEKKVLTNSWFSLLTKLINSI
ncbi:hypothetical protein Ciccas_000294 [Cichlidogyrus casuarinus]|uniref:Uncharacterized protein n=1 Tax=Cichlidogyrus casuarinus TaxID=1844966 RepID=A0ABD2QNC6_9PLAT